MFIQSEHLSEIGRRVRKIRLNRNLPITIANKIRNNYDVKLDPLLLSRLEQGKGDLSLTVLFALADFFDISVSSLLPDDIRNELSHFPPEKVDETPNTSTEASFELPENIVTVIENPDILLRLVRIYNTLGEKEITTTLSHHLDSLIFFLKPGKKNSTKPGPVSRKETEQELDETGDTARLDPSNPDDLKHILAKIQGTARIHLNQVDDITFGRDWDI